MKSWGLSRTCEKIAQIYVSLFFWWSVLSSRSFQWTQNGRFLLDLSPHPMNQAARSMVFERLVLRAPWIFFDNFLFSEKLWFQFVHFWGFPALWTLARHPKISTKSVEFGKNRCAPPQHKGKVNWKVLQPFFALDRELRKAKFFSFGLPCII